MRKKVKKDKKDEKIEIIVINKPSKEQADKKTKDLIEFLKNTWFSPVNTKKE
jgi:hypothetical protein